MSSVVPGRKARKPSTKPISVWLEEGTTGPPKPRAPIPIDSPAADAVIEAVKERFRQEAKAKLNRRRAKR